MERWEEARNNMIESAQKIQNQMCDHIHKLQNVKSDDDLRQFMADLAFETLVKGMKKNDMRHVKEILSLLDIKGPISVGTMKEDKE
jgi:hypothetical protein